MSQDHIWHAPLHLVALSSPSLSVWDGLSVPLSFVTVTVSRGVGQVSWGILHLGLPGVLPPGWFAPLTSGQLCVATALHAQRESACPAQWSQGCAFPLVSWGTVCRGGEPLLGRRGVHYSPECGLVCCFYVELKPSAIRFILINLMN